MSLATKVFLIALCVIILNFVHLFWTKHKLRKDQLTFVQLYQALQFQKAGSIVSWVLIITGWVLVLV